MVNHAILGGLKIALERGESMKKAMATFLNSGYKKEEIEEAARVITENSNKIAQSSKIDVPVSAKEKKFNFKNFIVHKQSGSKISTYGEPELPEIKLATIPKTIVQEEKEEEKLLQEEEKLPVPKRPVIEEKIVIQKPKPIQEQKMQEIKPIQNISQNVEPVQKISNYGEEKPKKSSIQKLLLTLTLIAILIVLTGFLIIAVLSREQLIIFFSKLFSQ